jgi:hypothetical protein
MASRLALDGEELGWPEGEGPRDQQVREGIDARVVDPYGAVVETARVLQVILDLDEVALQLQEVAVCLELGPGLGQGDQPVQPDFHLALDPRLFGRRTERRRARAQFRDRLERGPLVARIGLHCLDQLRDQLVPARELHVDIAPRRAHLVTLAHQAVEDDHAPAEQAEHHQDQDPSEHAAPLRR